MTTWCREHLAILDALEHGDQKTAARLMAQHLEKARTSGRLAGERLSLPAEGQAGG